MRNDRNNLGADVGLLLVRLLVGGLFVLAGWYKIQSPLSSVSQAVMAYGLFPDSARNLAGLVAVFLPWVELLAGLCCLAGLWGRGGALLIVIMLAVFTVAKAQVIVRGINPGGSFSKQLWFLDFGSWYGVGVNLFILLLAILLLIQDMGRVRLDRLLPWGRRGLTIDGQR